MFSFMYKIPPLRYLWFKTMYTDLDHMKSVQSLISNIKAFDYKNVEASADLKKVVIHLGYIEDQDVTSDFLKNDKFFASYAADIAKASFKMSSGFQSAADYAISAARYHDTLTRDQLSHLVKSASSAHNKEAVKHLINNQHIEVSALDGYKIIEAFKDNPEDLKFMKNIFSKECKSIDNVMYDFFYDGLSANYKSQMIFNYEQFMSAADSYIQQYNSYGMIKHQLDYPKNAKDVIYIYEDYEKEKYHKHHINDSVETELLGNYVEILALSPQEDPDWYHV